jgi:hypothetical protein
MRGDYDRILHKRAWRQLKKANVVWAGDRFKAELAHEFGGLTSTPLVCHNVPNADYMPELTWPRDSWLRAELRKQGASLGESGGCIVVRAGAVGEYGGIVKTLEAISKFARRCHLLDDGSTQPRI